MDAFGLGGDTMKRWIVVIGVLAAMHCGVARADLRARIDAFWARFQKDYRRTNCWPTPFVQPDREATRAPWAIMTHNGWRAHNTLGQQSFTEQNELTSAGRTKIKWIITQAPVERRSVYVLRGDTPDATRDRLQAVRDIVSEVTGAQTAEAMVVVTNRVPRAGAGDYMDRVDSKARDAIPAPVLPARENAGN